MLQPWEYVNEIYRAIPPANHLPFPGIAVVCAFICDRGGLNIAVTHRGIESTQRLLDAHTLGSFFTDILSVEQEYPRKPDPALVLAALEKHGLNRIETLLIDDRDLDVQAGRTAGVHTCLFGQTKLTIPADFQIDQYSQLLSLLQETDQ